MSGSQDARVTFLEGFHHPERSELRAFRWMAREASCLVQGADADDWLIFEAGHAGEEPVRLRIAGAQSAEVHLLSGWQQLAFPVAELAAVDGAYRFSCENRLDAPGDTRELSLMIGDIRVGRPTAYERNSARFYRNLFRKTVLDTYPTFVALETSSVCNMRCAMCIVDEKLGYLKKDPRRSFRDVRGVYEELLPYASKLQLHATGEVFIGEGFWEALEMARPHALAHPLEIEVFTNGQLLTPEVVDRVLDTPLTDICISIDAATERTYRRLRGGDFNRLLKNIEHLAARAAGTRLRVALSCILMRENLDELPQLVRLADSLGVRTLSYSPLLILGAGMPLKTAEDGFVFFYRQQMLRYYPHRTVAAIAEARRAAAETGVHMANTPCFRRDYSGFALQDVDYPLTPEAFETAVADGRHDAAMEQAQDKAGFSGCYFPWQIAMITNTGAFSPCQLLKYQGGIGSVDGGFMAAWNNPQMQSLRRHIIDNDIHALCKNAQCRFVNLRC